MSNPTVYLHFWIKKTDADAQIAQAVGGSDEIHVFHRLDNLGHAAQFTAGLLIGLGDSPEMGVDPQNIEPVISNTMADENREERRDLEFLASPNTGYYTCERVQISVSTSFRGE